NASTTTAIAGTERTRSSGAIMRPPRSRYRLAKWRGTRATHSVGSLPRKGGGSTACRADTAHSTAPSRLLLALATEAVERAHVDALEHRQDQHDRQRDKAEPEQHGGPAAGRLLDLAVDAEPADDAMQRRRDDEALDDERNRRGDEQMRRLVGDGLPGDRHGE